MAFDFPSSPAVGQVFGNYIWDGEKWKLQGGQALGAVRYDTPQILTAGQQTQARDNIRVQKKNYIINGAMMVSQENGTTIGAASSVYWPVDCFQAVNSTAGQLNCAQNLSSFTPGGSPARIFAYSATLATSIVSDKLAMIGQNIEGNRVADLQLGTAKAKTFTIQFGVTAPAGTYGLSVTNADSSRVYMTTYTISAGEANTDVIKSVTIPGDTSGTWLTNNNTGLTIRWCLAIGTVYQGTAGAWSSANVMGTSSQYNLFSVVNNNFFLFDVSLTEGTVAPPFVVPDYASELALCQRYYQSNVGALGHWQEGSASQAIVSFPHVPSMRAPPTIGVLLTTSRISRYPTASYNIGGSVLVIATNSLGSTVDVNTALAAANVPAFLLPGTLSLNARL